MSIRNIITGILFGVFYLAGLISGMGDDHECKDEYKEAYMNHVELCDTLHERCFRIGN